MRPQIGATHYEIKAFTISMLPSFHVFCRTYKFKDDEPSLYPHQSRNSWPRQV
ncbi:unnamed protein product [Victoria cruziana]